MLKKLIPERMIDLFLVAILVLVNYEASKVWVRLFPPPLNLSSLLIVLQKQVTLD